MKLLSDVIKPTPRQREFLKAVEGNTYTLYGGAAGGGKSYILRWTLIYLLIKWYKTLGLRGIRVGLFCEDYPALRERHLSKIAAEFPDWLGTYKESTHEFTLKEKFGGGVLAFRNLDKVSKYLSSEFAAIAVDELTLNNQTVFDFLRMRLRWPGIDNPKFIAGTNPGGIGHTWVKAIFVDGEIPKELQAYRGRIAFVRAFVKDNPYLPASYLEALATLPDELRKAYLDGSWDIFEGQFFSGWNRDIHVIKPFKIPDGWMRFRMGDWGSYHPYAFYWGAVDYDGKIYIYRELYGYGGKADVGTKETSKQVGQKVAAAEAGDKHLIQYGVLDNACWNKQDPGAPSIAEEINKVMVANGCRPFNPSIKGREQVAEEIRLRLEGYRDNEGKQIPGIYFFSTCVHLIRTLPSVTHDKYNPEKYDTNCEDHAVDAIGYGCMSRPYKPARPKQPDQYELDGWNDHKVISPWGV